MTATAPPARWRPPPQPINPNPNPETSMSTPATRKTLIATIAEQDGLPRKQVERVLDGLIEAMRCHLATGQEVRLPGLGNFKVQPVPARSGTSAVGGAWSKPAGRRVVFRPAQALKTLVDLN